MTFSLKRINAIFIKDWKDLQRNSYILFTVALPLFFAAWIGRMGEDSPYMFSFPINLALVISGAFIQAAMVAEEKEKNTLRGLLLSPASTIEILIGKSALSVVMTILVVVLSIILLDYNVPSLPLFALSILLGIFFYIAVGTILGLISRTVMETSIIGMPVLFIFGMGSMFRPMIENESILNVMDLLPNEQLTFIWISLEKQNAFLHSWDHFALLLLWTFISFVVTAMIYKKRKVD